MEVSVRVVGVAAFVVLAFVLVGGPMFVVDWSRSRSRTVAARQIALTDALDAALGPIVAPVVSKRLFRPWEIQIAVPFLRSAVLARMVSGIDDVFSVEGGSAPAYRIVLSPKQEPLREAGRRRTHRSPKRWAGNPVGAV